MQSLQDSDQSNPDGTPKSGPGVAVPAAPAPAPTPSAPAAAAPAQAASPAQQPAGQDYGGAYHNMMARGESSGNPNARRGDSVGLYAIQTPAWTDVTGHSPIVNGVDERLDPKKNAAVFDEITRRNTANFQQTMGRAPTPLELAVMHQQGALGGMRLLDAAKRNPSQPAVQIVGSPAKLVQNGIPPNATAAQAVAKIQGYYGKFLKAPGSQGAAQPQAQGQSQDDDGLQAPLQEDVDAQPKIPQMPAAPNLTPPTWSRVDPKLLAQMTPKEKAERLQTVKQENLLKQKDFADATTTAKTKYQSDLNDYNAAVKAAKAPKTGLEYQLKDQGEIAAFVKSGRPDPNDKTDIFNALNPVEQKVGDDVAFELSSNNKGITPQQAYGLAAILLNNKVTPNLKDPTSPTVKVGYTAHKMPGDSNNVRIRTLSGSTYMVPMKTWHQIKQVQNDAIDAANKPTGGDSYAKDLARAGGRVIKNVVKPVARAALHPVDTVGAGFDALASAPRTAEPIGAAIGVAKNLANRGVAAVNDAFSDR